MLRKSVLWQCSDFDRKIKDSFSDGYNMAKPAMKFVSSIDLFDFYFKKGASPDLEKISSNSSIKRDHNRICRQCQIRITYQSMNKFVKLFYLKT